MEAITGCGFALGALTSKSKPARDAAARALGRLGNEAVPRATKLLAEKKADTRAAAVTC